MKKYTCVDKHNLRVRNFASFKEEKNNQYRLVDLDKGIIFEREYETEKKLEVLLEVHFDIKIKKDYF
jgi:hypothetical protein